MVCIEQRQLQLQSNTEGIGGREDCFVDGMKGAKVTMNEEMKLRDGLKKGHKVVIMYKNDI